MFSQVQILGMLMTGIYVVGCILTTIAYAPPVKKRLWENGKPAKLAIAGAAFYVTWRVFLWPLVMFYQEVVERDCYHDKDRD